MIKFEAGYCSDKEWAEIDWEAVCAIMPEWPSEKPKDYYAFRSHKEIRPFLSYYQASQLCSVGLKLEILPLPGNMLVKLAEKYNGSGDEIKDINSGSIVQIHVPDLALLMYNEVTWLDDSCTEKVQEMLDDGWRIIAVCPPNAQRRPDYIFGRYTKGREAR